MFAMALPSRKVASWRVKGILLFSLLFFLRGRVGDLEGRKVRMSLVLVEDGWDERG